MEGIKRFCFGIVAHVDAGKTTLSEALLYLSGGIRKIGRVDYKDTFLDTHHIEKERGITIFSKQAILRGQDIELALLDTPGHVDFSAEMERTLQVLDYAVLVISGSDGVQGHTETLWKLLKRYKVPVFIFVNKMDLENSNKEEILLELQRKLSENCVDFSNDIGEEFFENIAVCEESLLDSYMEKGIVEKSEICNMISRRKIFPCFFGSALRMEGVEEFYSAFLRYTKNKSYQEKFGARVYKIARGEQNKRLTYLKVTGGSLSVKQLITNERQISHGMEQGEIWKEKIDQIRIYSGVKYENVQEVKAGMVCAVSGLHYTFPGECLGNEYTKMPSVLEPVLTYQVILPDDCSPRTMYPLLKELEEEDPKLHLLWNEQNKEILVQLMGEVQIEVLQNIIKERYNILVEFGSGSIVYKETIKNRVEGVGHFEPLRHYAEVHVLLEPMEQGSGLHFSVDCSEDVLDKNWQRLILTHLEEKEHLGVLTGSPITDMRITLVSGRAHQKHTEGGDFRQATYRAVRQGLKMAESILLEPYYAFTLEVPTNCIGRAMSDIQRKYGTFFEPKTEGEMSVLKGSAPVSTMQDYIQEVQAYTHGTGRLFCELKGYEPCHNPEEIIEMVGYDSEQDTENPTSSVFCTHGAGFIVKWNEVREYMHVESSVLMEDVNYNENTSVKTQHKSGSIEQDEVALEKIMIREFGENWKRYDDYGNVTYGEQKEKKREKIKSQDADPKYVKKPPMPKKEFLLVDGYNILFAWEDLKDLAKVSLDAARNCLLEQLCNYQGYKQQTIIVVFDAYKVKGNIGNSYQYNNVYVVFTKEAETADMYIEKVTHEIAKKHKVTVATSDAIEQMIILQQGAIRMSAKELEEEVAYVKRQIRDIIEK
ncbi:MAG: GTP-binding protein [Lachnospiraceae bacterium]|nr:GTP-binding protein [Lachnospiraceae bacterium]